MRRLEIAALAVQGLRRSPLRVTLTTLGVTFATGMLVTMIALSLGVQRQVETPFHALALLNNIEVRPEEQGDKKPRRLNDEALAEMEKLPGVAAAYPDAHVKNIHLRYGDKETTAIGLAMPPEAALLGVSQEVLLAGRLFDEADRHEAVIGTGIVAALGLKSAQDALGKEIAVEAAALDVDSKSKFTFGRDAFTVTIVGVYQAPMIMGARAQSGIFMPVELMRRLPGMYMESAWNLVESGGDPKAAGFASATVRVSDANDITRVEKQIRAMGFHTRSILSRLHDMRRFFLAIQILLTVVGAIALTIAALGIANTLLMAVLERYQEIGLCKAIGASDGDLFVLFLTEAGIIGLIGGVSGILLGWLMSHGMEALATLYAHRQDIAGRLDLFAFPLWLMAASLAFAIAISVVAGIYPALRAARVDPIRALRSH